MKKLLKKITALLLCALFLFSTPVKSFAAENNSGIEPANQRAINRYFSEDCPIGLPSNYTQLISSTPINITFTRQQIIELSQTDVAVAIAFAVGNISPAASGAVLCFTTAAHNCIEAKAFEDSDETAMSIKVMVFRNPTHSTGSDEFYRYAVSYYKQANCVGYIGVSNYYETVHYT